MPINDAPKGEQALVVWFSGLMQDALDRNRDKGDSWKLCDEAHLRHCLSLAALRGGHGPANRADRIRALTNTANYAAMLAARLADAPVSTLLTAPTPEGPDHE